MISISFKIDSNRIWSLCIAPLWRETEFWELLLTSDVLNWQFYLNWRQEREIRKGWVHCTEWSSFICRSGTDKKMETFRAWVWNIWHGFLQIFLVVHLNISRAGPMSVPISLFIPHNAGHWGWLQMVEDWNTFKLTSISTEIRPDLICILWFVGTYGDGGGGRGMFSSNCHQN